MTPDDLARQALARIEETGEPADRVLKQTLRKNRWLDNDGRRRVAQLVHGLRAHRVRLSYLGDRLDRTDLVALYDDDQRGLLPSVEWPEDPVERLRVERSLPAFVADAFHRTFDEAADEVAATLNTPGPIAIRANTLQNDREALADRLRAEGMTVELGRLAPHALRIARGADIRGSTAWREGRFEVQDEASQMVGVAVDAQPGEHIIDLCAGAGGKTLALAAAMADRGRVVACDVDTDRLHDLRVRLERVGLTSVTVVDLRDQRPAPGADRVLVDAPCSAVGTWRRGPDRKWHVTEDAVAAFAETQRELLALASTLVRPGGRVVYATCTLLDAENEAVVRACGLERIETRTILPHVHDTDGFFIATLRAPS